MSTGIPPGSGSFQRPWTPSNQTGNKAQSKPPTPVESPVPKSPNSNPSTTPGRLSLESHSRDSSQADFKLEPKVPATSSSVQKRVTMPLFQQQGMVMKQEAQARAQIMSQETSDMSDLMTKIKDEQANMQTFIQDLKSIWKEEQQAPTKSWVSFVAKVTDHYNKMQVEGKPFTLSENQKENIIQSITGWGPVKK